MSRRLDADGERLWAVVSATVRPLAGREAPPAPPAAPPAAPSRAPVTPSVGASAVSTAAAPPRRPGPSAPAPIEPGRHRRLITERDPITARIDLHGMTQDEARRALTEFILRRAAEGARSVLVITGKGSRGDGVLRRRAPDWLAEPPLRAVVAGLSEAHRRHGGGGALYVALKRQSRA
jgi:DNA-nicking Smr family endonuclease